jgi:hypothetical protein
MSTSRVFITIIKGSKNKNTRPTDGKTEKKQIYIGEGDRAKIQVR